MSPSSDTTQKREKENKDLTRKEEPTKAPTPDKLDRSARLSEKDEVKPYPLTEEEATPKAGVHERDHSLPKETSPSKSVHKDYNRLVSADDEKDT